MWIDIIPRTIPSCLPRLTKSMQSIETMLPGNHAGLGAHGGAGHISDLAVSAPVIAIVEAAKCCGHGRRRGHEYHSKEECNYDHLIARHDWIDLEANSTYGLWSFIMSVDEHLSEWWSWSWTSWVVMEI